MTKDLNWYFNVIKEFVISIKKEEVNPYYLASFTRISNTIDAAKLLNDNSFALECPVMIRIAIEHAARIGYLKKNPEKFIQFADMTKVFGKGPLFAETLKVFDSGSASIYELVSAFSHPDALSLVMSQDNNQQGKSDLLSIINIVAAAFLLDMLITTYPLLQKPISDEEYQEIGATLILSIADLVGAFSSEIQEENLQFESEMFSNIFALKSKIGAPILEWASTLNGKDKMDQDLFQNMLMFIASKNEVGKK
ncbi:hypothetical protein QIH01_23225 [Brevibacillus brevis]|nr:hypothetical protein QIH01_23225 [Brevibacillus brevis]